MRFSRHSASNFFTSCADSQASFSLFTQRLLLSFPIHILVLNSDRQQRSPRATEIRSTAQKPSFTVNFPKWWKTEKLNTILTFSDISKRMVNLLFTLSKTQEKHEVHRILPRTRKIPMNSLFSWKVFYSFPERANAAICKRFPTELLTVNAVKTWCFSIVFLLHENARI